jgi:phosphoribosylanthranilate isomerase
MSLWIKICANTSPEDALVAAEAGADAVGLIFAPSPRRVTAEQGAVIARRLPASVEKVGVFVESSFGEIAATVEAASLTGVQLHWDAPADLPAKLRARFGPKLRILRVMHFGAGADPATLTADEHIDAILVDSRTTEAVGGTGRRYDWSLAGRTLFQSPERRKPLIAAGGLTPENVAEAIATMLPWGVDVVSGVEAAPGRKDPVKVRAFIASVRATKM